MAHRFRSRSARAILDASARLFEAKRDEIAHELTLQMGRPIRYAPNEVRGTLERARHMIDIAPRALADIDVGPKEGFTRFLRREPLGVVLTIAAWNYPYLIAVNSVVPALMAGNYGAAQAFGADAAVRRALRDSACARRACRRASSSRCT